MDCNILRRVRHTIVTFSTRAAAFVSIIATSAGAQANAPVIGRWDLTVQGANGPYPSWVRCRCQVIAHWWDVSWQAAAVPAQFRR